jgi:hypothetical protein
MLKLIVPTVSTDESTVRVPDVPGRKPHAVLENCVCVSTTEDGVKELLKQNVRGNAADAPVTPERPDNVTVASGLKLT